MKKLTTSLLTLSLGLTLASSSFAAKLYVVNFPNIVSVDTSGSNLTTLVSGANASNDIKLDISNSKMYWLSSSGLNRANFDGSNVENVISASTASAFALDLTNSKIYWFESEPDAIFKADLDGSNSEMIFSSPSFGYIRDIELDIPNSKIYFADDGNSNISRSNFDGSSFEVLVTGLENKTISLDLTNSKIYWSNLFPSKIQRSNLDGSNVEDLITTGFNVFGPAYLELDLVNSKIYITESDKISRANLDGTGLEDVITGIGSSDGIALDLVDAPLSVELNSFSARQIENSIQLNWSTASETENGGFNIYRKTGEKSFIQIASHKSHRELKGQGNTSVETFYTFVDDSKLQNNELYTYVISDVETNGLETKHEENAQSVFFEVKTQAVKRFELAQNFPNPFNPSTTISYQIARDTKVSLKIYNEKGDFVKELTNDFQHEGSHNAVWNGTDSNGKSVSSGTYFYKITAGTFTQTNKMILLK